MRLVRRPSETGRDPRPSARTEADLPEWVDVDTSYMKKDSFRFTTTDGQVMTGADLRELYVGSPGYDDDGSSTAAHRVGASSARPWPETRGRLSGPGWGVLTAGRRARTGEAVERSCLDRPIRLSITTPSQISATIEGRPIRHAILVPRLDELSWMRTFTGVLAALSRVWGGSGAFVFPLEEAEAQHELFWRLVELFDPDAWEVYVPSTADLESLDATAFAKRKKEVENVLAALPAVPDGEVDPERDRVWAEPIADVWMSDELNQVLVARGAPFQSDGRMLLRGGFSGSGVPYPMVDALDLPGAPDSLHVPDVPSDNEPLRLLAAAQWGELSPSALQRIMAERFTPSPVDIGGELAFIRRLFGLESPILDAPFSLAQPGLAWLVARPRAETRLTVVAGETPLDFSLAYAFRRSRDLAYWWCPSAFDPKYAERAMRELAQQAHRLGVPVDVTSVSDDKAVKTVAADIRAARGRNVSERDWREVIPDAANSLVFAKEPAHPQTYSLVDGATPPLQMPSPVDLAPDDPSKVRWVGEIEVGDWNAMCHPDIGGSVAFETTAYDSRSSQSGIAVGCPSSFIRMSVPLPWQLPRPRLGPLPLLDQLSVVARTKGWQAELSDKGSYAVATIELFGGVEAVCRSLDESEVRAVLHAYQDADDRSPGKRLRDRRRYLSLDDLTSLPGVTDASALLQRLEERRVLVRGLVLKCARCRHTDFFRAEAAEPAFTCPRCSWEQRPDQSAWLGTSEPVWHYRLDEVVFQFISHRGEIPLLAAYERFATSKHVIALVPEIQLGPPGGLREVDFAITEGNRLWLGEAFSADRFDPTNHREHTRLTELKEAAETFNARGVLLTTSAPAMNAGTRKRAESVFSDVWPQLVISQGAKSLPRPTKLLARSD
jgi:hypothetical protein